MAGSRSSGRRSSVGVLLLSLLIGCTSPAPASQAPSTGPGASTGTQSTIVLPSGFQIRPGPLDPATARALVPLPPTDQAQLAAVAGDLGAAVRGRVGAAAAYGQGATDLQALMDQTETAALQKLQDKVKALAAGQSDTGGFELAAFRRPGVPAAGSPHMALLTIAMLFVIIAGGVGVSMFDPKHGDIPVTTLTQSDTKSTDAGTMDVRASFVISSSGGVLTVAITLTGNGSRTDAATGKTTTMSGGASIVFSVNPCPDPAGHVGGTIAISDDETFSSIGGPTVGYKIAGTTDYVTLVNDEAQIDSTQMTSKMDRAITTATPSTSGSADTTAIDIAVTGSDTITGAGTFGPDTGSFTVDKVDGPVQDSDIISAAGLLGTFGYGPPIMLSNAARDTWRSGRCFEIRPKPDGGDVSPSSKTSIDVTVYHWVDKADIKVPVKATLAGTKAIDPDGQPVTSPAKFTFTAGAPDSTGDVTYNVTSKRGMATRVSHFKVRAGLLVSITGTLDETAVVVTYKLKVSATDILVTPQPDGSLAFSGRVSVTGTASGMTCSGTINQQIDVIGRGSLTGPEDAPVYHFQFGPGSLTSLGGAFSCPGIAANSNKGDFFGQWSTTLGFVDLPAEGGTRSLSGSNGSAILTRSAKGTFTARPN